MKCDSLENHSRRNNLLFFGLQKERERESWEDCEEIVKKVIKDGMGISENIDIERAHRIKNDVVVVKFLSFKQKNTILLKSSTLKRSDSYKNITVREDFSSSVRAKRKGLHDLQKTMFESGKNPKLRFDKLICYDGVFTYDLKEEKVVQLRTGVENKSKGFDYDEKSGGEAEEDGHGDEDEGGAVGGEQASTVRVSDDWDYDPFGFDQRQTNDTDPILTPENTGKSHMSLRQRPARPSQKEFRQTKINTALGYTAQATGQGQPATGRKANASASRGKGRDDLTKTNK